MDINAPWYSIVGFVIVMLGLAYTTNKYIRKNKDKSQN